MCSRTTHALWITSSVWASFQVLETGDKWISRLPSRSAATSDLNWRRTVDTGKKLSHLFPRRALRQIFVGVKPGRIDGFGDACGAPTSTAGIAKERAQRLYMERHASSLPLAGNSAGEVFGDGHR